MHLKQNIVRIICALIVLAVALVTIWDFSRQLQTSLINDTYKTLSNVSKDFNKAFLTRISYDIKTLKMLAASLTEMQGRDKDDILRVLQYAVNDGEFTKIVVCASDGTSYSNEGVSANISGREYFKQAMNGNTIITKPLVSIVNGKKTLL